MKIASNEVLVTLSDLVSINSINPAYEDGRSEEEVATICEEFFEKRRDRNVSAGGDAGALKRDRAATRSQCATTRHLRGSYGHRFHHRHEHSAV